MTTSRGALVSLVLAAGGSRRMGRPKLLLPLGGTSVLARAVQPHLDAGVRDVVVVLGCDAEQVLRAAGLPAEPNLRTVVNAAWASGISSSLRCGLDAADEAGAVLVALADQPDVSASLVRRVIDAWDGVRSLVVPRRGRRAGHPVLFARRLFDELRRLQGDVGAREVVLRHWREAIVVAGEPGGDLDTPDDYDAYLAGRPGREDGLDLGEGEG